MTLSKTEGLKALGANVDRNSYPHEAVDAALLERARVPTTGEELVVTLDCPEFTSLCPMTNQPDFGEFKITYMPGSWIVESKSLKLYLGSFRQTGEFHEACAARILGALVELIEPRWMVVKGVFRPRGGIAINPTAIHRTAADSIPHWVFLKD